MAWPAAIKAVLSILSLVGGGKKDGASKLLKVSDLVGDLSSQNQEEKKRKKYESYARNPTFESFLSNTDQNRRGGM